MWPTTVCPSKVLPALALCLLLGVQGAHAWDQEQLEVFDVVEEVNQNFYQLMNISQDAKLPEIKSAFRALSLKLHPDKNPDRPDADEQFRNLVSVYEVLKSPEKRRHYDEVLVNGLPNWRSAVYYYRHYRKMGFTEMCIILFVLVTIGQYLIGWAAYFEKKFTHEQVYQPKLEKRKKKLSKKGQNTEEILEIEQFQIARPSIYNTLPVQIPKFIWYSVTGLPAAIRHLQDILKESDRIKKQQLEEIRIQRELELEIEQKKIRDKELKRRKQAAFKLEERDDYEIVQQKVENKTKVPDKPSVPVSGGLWTDDDLAELIQLVKKFPGGTTDRWERIAEQMFRSVSEVTYMAAKLKENCYRLPGQVVEEAPMEEIQPKKQKTKGGKTGTVEGQPDEWTQLQQKALETALAKHPKGPADRWEKIAKCVPEKTKEECMLRYKYLVELVKKKKETTDQEADQEQDPINPDY